MEIMPNVHLVPGIIANPYLIIDPDGLTLIDTGLPGSDRKIMRYIIERGFKADDLKRIIITHSDMDHVGGLYALKRASGARVYASAIEAGAIEKGAASRRTRPAHFVRRLLMGILRQFFKASAVKVDQVVEDNQELPSLGGLRVVFTPGHTPGHISLFSPTQGILFVGDSIVSRDHELAGSLPANTWDQEQAAESVRKQAALGATVICPGHGPVVKDAVGKMPVA